MISLNQCNCPCFACPWLFPSSASSELWHWRTLSQTCLHQRTDFSVDRSDALFSPHWGREPPSMDPIPPPCCCKWSQLHLRPLAGFVEFVMPSPICAEECSNPQTCFLRPNATSRGKLNLPVRIRTFLPRKVLHGELVPHCKRHHKIKNVVYKMALHVRGSEMK